MMQELNYIRCGDYYIPDIRLPKESRSIGRFGRLHREYLMEHNPIRFDDLCLTGELWTYLADLNEQAQIRMAVSYTHLDVYKRQDGMLGNHKQKVMVLGDLLKGVKVAG